VITDNGYALLVSHLCWLEGLLYTCITSALYTIWPQASLQNKLHADTQEGAQENVSKITKCLDYTKVITYCIAPQTLQEPHQQNSSSKQY